MWETVLPSDEAALKQKSPFNLLDYNSEELLLYTAFQHQEALFTTNTSSIVHIYEMVYQQKHRCKEKKAITLIHYLS